MRGPPLAGVALVALLVGIPVGAGATRMTSTGPATTLAVTTNDDAVNGDVSSPDALVADPGPDGISLREAITAADNGGGFVTITFSGGLGGETISPQDSYNVTQPDIAVMGSLGNGLPTVTLDAAHNVAPQIFAVRASGFTVRGLRMTDIGAGGYATGISANAGDAFSPQFIHDLRIENNVFSDTGVPAGSRANAIYLSMQPTATGAEISNVTITGNSFVDFGNGSDGVLAGAGGSGGLLRNVGVEGNTFSNVTYAVEFGDSDTNGRIEGARIVGNTITGGEEPLDLNFIGVNGGPPTTGNVIDGTLVARNVIRDARGPDLVLLGGLTNAAGNSITNTRIQDNVMSGDTTYGGVSVVGGRDGASNNVIDGVQVTNDTIVQDMGGVSVNADLGGSGDSVSGVTVLNSIIVRNSLDYDHVAASQVSFSFSDQSGYAGTNGNISGDPLFVDSAGGDFHLQAGSPAIDAGTSNGAPATDLECRVRVDDPATANTGGGASPYYDMGAYEFGSPAADCLNTSVASGPATFTQSANAAFMFSSNDPSATFECSLDGAAFATCASPQNYSDVPEGAHTFDVRAVGADGNQDPAPATYEWVVDTTPPGASIDSKPSSLVNFTDASFAFSANEASTFQCSLDSGSFTDCTSPVSYSGLGEGTHTFAVQATDRAGNTGTAAGYSWAIDTTPPVASIDSEPPSLTNSTDASFTFSANETSTFRCSLDSGPFTDCTSSTSYSGLNDGAHNFNVQATDQAGNTGTATGYSWTVDTTPPTLDTVSIEPPTIPVGGSTTLTASASSDAVAADSYVDTDKGPGQNDPLPGGSGSFTASPYGSALPAGTYTIGVRVRDAAGNWSPVQTTTLMVAPPVELDVSQNGPGHGSVTSSPAGIACPSACSTNFDYGTKVTLTATPAHGSAFAGWSGGGCSGTGTCQATMNGNTSVTATFASTPTLTVHKSGTGSGKVSSDVGGIDCGATCAATVDTGTPITLTAIPDAGSTFTGWSGGGCSGTGTCRVTVGSDTTVTATFGPTHTLTVEKLGSGSGSVRSDVGGIDCGATCTGVVDDGTQVTLTATADAGSVFTGWSGGGCSLTGTCQVVVTAATTVTATFAQIQCVVPNVKGKTLAGAKRAITAGHCAVGKISHAASKKVAKNKVASQSPRAGTHLKDGAKVNLVLSKGKKP